MKLYLDIIFIINFAFDFLLLLVTDIILKRNTKFYKLILSALVGSLSIFILFIKINSVELFIIKILISVLMILIAFKYHNIKYFIKNMITLYIASFLLGGFLYYLNMTFSYRQEGLIFFYDGMSINYIFLLIISPIILYFYIKQSKSIKTNYSKYYKTTITLLDNEKIVMNSYLDTGNNLIDPITNKKIILIEKELINAKYQLFPLYVPYRVLNHKSLLTCIRIKEIKIDGLGSSKNVLLGLSDKFNIDGINAVLNNKLMEELR